MSTITTLEELFVEQLQDLYSAENQLIKALPAMAKAAHSPALKAAFQTHFTQTEEHAVRLEQIFENLGKDAIEKKCQAMEGLIKEGKEMISEKATAEIKDVGLIAAAQRVEHYEIAGYGCVRTYAKILGHTDAARALQTTLDEEAATDKKLTVIAEKLNLLPQEEAALKN
ncbi:MAG: ferritin-like domain-containing protein [Methylacidiphilales bacterium]|nr:ferritin-like domain-containing protein [Candidatus Methylacidiphilales bacterium]